MYIDINMYLYILCILVYVNIYSCIHYFFFSMEPRGFSIYSNALLRCEDKKREFSK